MNSLLILLSKLLREFFGVKCVILSIRVMVLYLDQQFPYVDTPSVLSTKLLVAITLLGDSVIIVVLGICNLRSKANFWQLINEIVLTKIMIAVARQERYVCKNAS